MKITKKFRLILDKETSRPFFDKDGLTAMVLRGTIESQVGPNDYTVTTPSGAPVMGRVGGKTSSKHYFIDKRTIAAEYEVTVTVDNLIAVHAYEHGSYLETSISAEVFKNDKEQWVTDCPALRKYLNREIFNYIEDIISSKGQ